MTTIPTDEAERLAEYHAEEARHIDLAIAAADHDTHRHALISQKTAAALRSLSAERDALADVLDGKRALAREIDVVLNGPDGAAERPALVDVLHSAHRLREERDALAAECARLRHELEQIALDCECDYPPSHGAIKHAARAALGARAS